MKKNLAIVAFLVICLICAFAFTSHAQERDKCPSVVDTILLADETFMSYTKTEARITCDNESVFNDIFKTHGTLFKRFTCTWKTDRHGRYKHYVAYLTKEDAELIKSWAKTNL
jgi:hypothetical protein